MADAFDAYHEWLGIPPEEQPPDYYRLLGIARFEAKLSVIEHAADRQMAHVRNMQAGSHSEQSQTLLNEIASAKICLLDEERKEEYDAELRGAENRPSAEPADVEPLPPTPPAPPATRPAESDDTPPAPPAPPARRPPVRRAPDAETPVLVSSDTSSSAVHSHLGKKKPAIGTALLLGLAAAACCVLIAGGVLFFSITAQRTGTSPESVEEGAPSEPVEEETTDGSEGTGDATDPTAVELEGGEDSPATETTSSDEPEEEAAPDEPTAEPGPEQPPIEPAVLEPRPGAGSVDVLAAIDPDRHAIGGQWAKSNGRLTATAADDGQRATIELPAVVPDAYELKLAVTRKTGNGPLEMSLPVGRRQRAVLYLDRQGTLAGLEGSLGQGDAPLPSSERPVPLLASAETKLIICRVRPSQIRMTVDGEAVIDWKGEVADASSLNELPSLGGSAVYLAARDAVFQFDVLQLTALDPASDDPTPDPLKLPTPLARWTFDSDFADEIGLLEGFVSGAAQIRKGRLRLDGNSHVYSAPIDTALTERTLAIWLQFVSPVPPAASVMGISDGRRSDAVAYTGPDQKQWGSLSRLNRQAQPFDGPEETTPPGELIHLAVVYHADGAVVAYRNGLPYGQPIETGKTTAFEPGRARMFIGRGGSRMLQGLIGYIDQAQLFDRALTAEQVATLAAQRPVPPITPVVAVPDADARQTAADRLHERYGEELAENDPAERQMFTRRLVRKAEQSEDVAERYAALEMARDTFAQLGNVKDAKQVIGKLSERYEIDAPAMQLEAFLIAAHKAQGTQLMDIARQAEPAFLEALKQENFEAAEQILRMAQAAAKKTDQSAIAKRCVRNQGRLRKYEAALEKYQAAQATLKNDPDDASANQTVGRFDCFVKRDWPRGLPHLVRGEDEQLRELAKKELAGAASAAEQFELGHRWWKVAEKAEEHVADAQRKRACRWYLLAVPQLSGDVQAEAQRHLQEMEMAENSGWLVLFRAANASFWNTKIDDEDVYAIPLDSVRPEVRFLCLKREDTGHFVIVPMNLATLKSGGQVAPTLMWRNACPYIGIASSRLKVNEGQPCLAPGPDKRTAYGGWGFGQDWLAEDSSWSWQAQPLAKVAFEISVKSGPLTPQEQRGLLR